MKLITKTAIAAALSAIALSASAMTPIQDADLSQVSGQDGVSIAADLHVNVGSFVYKDTDSTGGSVSFNNIALTGTFAMTLDIINNATFKADAFGSVLGVVDPTAAVTAAITTATIANGGPLSPAQTAAAAASVPQYVAVAGFSPAGDVVKIAIPKIAVASGHELNMSVAGITMGNAAASYGSFAMNDIKLQGTTVYIWAH